MLELMTWSEIVERLREEGNLKMAAVFDLNGEQLATTKGVAISKPEIVGVLASLAAPCSSVYALYVGGGVFRCLQVDSSTLIGRSSGEIFVAHRYNDVLICGYTDCLQDAAVSCLAGVRNFALKLNMHPVSDAVAAPSLL